ncbi:MAG TPA: tetratricopeptide repeat protein, partial [bacterium]|nr:tetratricopeptide repeat protein [bacterium]
AAHAYREKGFKDLVSPIYKHILTIDPGQVGVADRLVDYYLQQGLIGDAVAVLENLARFYHTQGKKYEAAQILKKITDTDPDNKLIRLKVAKFFKEQEIQTFDLKKNKNDHAKNIHNSKRKNNIISRQETFFDLEKTLTSDMTLQLPNTVQETISPEIDSQAVHLRPERVFETLKNIVNEEPLKETPRFHFNMGMALYRYNNFEDAVEEFLAALYGYKDKASCYLMLSKCALALNRFEAAEGFAREGLSINGLPLQQQLALMYQLGIVRKSEGSIMKALAIFKSINELNSDFSGVAEQIRELTGQKQKH